MMPYRGYFKGPTIDLTFHVRLYHMRQRHYDQHPPLVGPRNFRNTEVLMSEDVRPEGAPSTMSARHQMITSQQHHLTSQQKKAICLLRLD